MEFDISKKIKKPRKSYFLSCFGFSIIEKELLSVNKSTSSKKKRKSSLSLSKIVRKHSSSAKTIPVDISDKFGNSSREIHVLNSEKVKTPVIAGEVTQAPVVKGKSQANIVHEKVVNKTKNIIDKNNKSLDPSLDKVHDYSTCRNEFSRSATICSTHNLSCLIKDKHEIKLSHSTSLPPPKRKKVNSREHLPSDNFDSIIGMSILIVTLLIMLFWGKACAIVCTCAWFYFLPRFRHQNEATVAGVVVNSEDYKKKVVLEGLLKRNHRNGV